MMRKNRRNRDRLHIRLEVASLSGVEVMESNEYGRQEREEDNDHIRALGELGHREYHDDESREPRCKAVDHDLSAIALRPAGEMVAHHPSSCHREAGEYADRVDRDQ